MEFFARAEDCGLCHLIWELVDKFVGRFHQLDHQRLSPGFLFVRHLMLVRLRIVVSHLLNFPGNLPGGDEVIALREENLSRVGAIRKIERYLRGALKPWARLPFILTLARFFTRDLCLGLGRLSVIRMDFSSIGRDFQNKL